MIGQNMRMRAAPRGGTFTLERESRVFPVTAALLLVTALSGFVTYLAADHGAVWQQWTYLLHTIQGLALAFLVAYFIYIHFRRTIGLRRPGLSLLGILVALASSAFAVSGVYLAFAGQSEGTRGVYVFHIAASLLALIALVVHVLAHRAFWPGTRQEQRPGLFDINPVARRCSALLLGLSVATVAAATLAYQALPSPFADRAVIEPYELSYGPHPFRPSQTETAHGGFYDVRRLGGSADCAACHGEIFEQWRSSMHAKAASDKAYQTNINLLAKTRGMATTRYCEGCHAPVALLSGQLTPGGRLDTPGHLEEGVGCLGCHGIGEIIHTNGVASYKYTPPEPYLFAGFSHPLVKAIHNYLLKLNPVQHRKDMARTNLAQPQMCATCHAQFMDESMNDWGWVKMQDEYTAWSKGPFSKQSQHTFSESIMQRCQDCHFPLQPGKDPSANADGLIRTHRSLGANTAIPWIDGDREQLERVTQFLQANRVAVTIDNPNRAQAVRSDRPIDPSVASVTENPGYYYLGEEVVINVVVNNVTVGHDFPGGTTDINEVWLHVRAVDGNNRVIFESGGIADNGEVDPGAYFYRSLPVDRAGKLVWRHDLFRMVGDSFKKVVPAGGSDVVPYRFAVPGTTKGPLIVSAVVRYRKFNNRYAKWALDDPRVSLPIVDMAATSLRVPIRLKPEAFDSSLARVIDQ